MSIVENAFLITITKVTQRSRQVQDYGDELEQRQSARDEFWEGFFDSLRIDNERKQYPTIDHWEAKISKEFGDELSQQVRQYFRVRFDRDGIGYAQFPTFAFKVKIVNYSSMLLGLDITGVQSLAQAFNADFDTFRILLEGFIDPAFAEVVGSNWASQMRYQVSPSSQIAGEFQKHPLMPQSNKSEVDIKAVDSSNVPNQVADKVRWTWILANTSLIVPFVLALAVLFIAYQEMANARNQYNSALRTVIDQQSKLLEEDRSRFAGYEVLQEQIVREYLQKLANPTASVLTLIPTPTVKK